MLLVACLALRLVVYLIYCLIGWFIVIVFDTCGFEVLLLIVLFTRTCVYVLLLDSLFV